LDEIKILIDEIKITSKGEYSWHGPSLMNTQKGIKADEASRRPLTGRHTIWEIVDHMSFWLNEISKSLMSERMPNPSNVKDWPPMGRTDKDWEKSVNKLENSIDELTDQLASFGKEKMESMVPGTNYSYRKMLNGILHHNIYHSGQISILKKIE
jgi:hypothetical protein